MERETGGDLDTADGLPEGLQRRSDLAGNPGHPRSTTGDRSRTAGALFSCGSSEDLRQFRRSQEAGACDETIHKVRHRQGSGHLMSAYMIITAHI